MSDGADPRPQAARLRPTRPAAAASLVLVREGSEGPSVLMGQRSARHRFMPRALVFPGGRVDRADRATAGDDPLGAFAAAALRETEEETGLTAAAMPPPLAYLCRLVTPAHLPIRFDARFLVGRAEDFAGTLGGSGELEFLRWIALEEAATLDLSQPTRVVIEELSIWLRHDASGRACHVAGTWRHRAGWLRRDPPGQFTARKISPPPGA
ncbi:NUDIX hydrolase [Elioraea rosea]|uniref:NUDIX hydrolase n=1 Tax=Elioraea rosea TaxID=2492390 RepID=UPI001183E422|nr:NUDIX domain-containing protein [Elioraea rosea]